MQLRAPSGGERAGPRAPPSAFLRPRVAWPLLLLAALLALLPRARARVLAIPMHRRPGNVALRRLDAPAFKDVAQTRKESDGVYYSYLRIGTPPQTFSVIVDTGSSTIAIPCQTCAKCGDRHTKFDKQKSSTAVVSIDRYSQCYSEGSCNSGLYVRDSMCLGETCPASEAVLHRFGCCDTYASAFQSQDADGIIGLSGTGDTLLADLRAHHELQADMFSLCFGKTKGMMTIGGYSPDLTLEDVQWVPYISQGSFYTVAVANLWVGGVSVPTSAVPIVDSGSTFTYLPRAVHAGAKAAFLAFCGGEGKCPGARNPAGTPSQDIRDSFLCLSPPAGVSGKDPAWLATFPPLDLEFGNQVRICVLPRNYLFLSSSAANAFCVGIFPDARMVIGAITLADFTVVFDHEQNRLGFAMSDCDGDQGNATGCCGAKCYPLFKRTPSPATDVSLAPQLPDQDAGSLANSTEPPDFWQAGPQVLSGYFFFMGMFFSVFAFLCLWLCCSRAPALMRRLSHEGDDGGGMQLGLDEETEGLAGRSPDGRHRELQMT